ncbi:MAG: molybdate ABC transporter substrate-binding protein [Acidobacteriota bacterium]
MKRLLLPLALGAWFVLPAVPTAAVELNVSAAASLTDALQEIAHTYEASSGDHILLNLGASSLLARQIEEGAPADLFLSADEAKMDSLAKMGLVLAGTRKSVLGNTLVVVVPLDSKLKIGAPADLASSSIRALALAEPQTVPAGIYAKEYLQKLGLWRKVIDRVVPTENVRAALAAVESGNADAGIVYKTDAEISDKVKVAYAVSEAEGPKISYPFAALAASRHPQEARRFLAYLASPPALDVFRRFGFLVISGPATHP